MLFQSRAEQSRAEQSRAEQSRAEQSRAEQDNLSGCSGGINFETTGNVFIEGDNLDALKLLQETYLNKIKMIYIDPPYNTGRDFIYKDKRFAEKNEYLEDSWQVDEYGNQWVKNKETEGRFHSDWLSFIYPRLKLARNLLRDDGVIFISIDDNEQANLKKLCDEIFGAENFIGCIARLTKSSSNKGNFFAPSHDYILSYAKTINSLEQFIDIEKLHNASYAERFKDEDEKGRYQTIGLYQAALDSMRGCSNQRYYIKCPDGTFAIPPGEVFPKIAADGEQVKPVNPADKVWRWSRDRYRQCDKNLLVFKQTPNSPLLDENGNQSKWNVYVKSYLDDRLESGVLPRSLILNKDNSLASRSLSDLGIPFSFPKPHELVEFLEQICGAKANDIILDFFAGSGTTAQAVIQLNAEDGGRRKFILVQLPEEVEAKSEAAKAGFKNIAEICKERIRRAGQMIKTGKYADGRQVKDWQPPKNSDLDIGFRVFKIASSNMREEYYCLPQNTDQAALTEKVDNVKKNRTDEDLLFQLFLEWGVPLSARIEKQEIDGKQVFFVNKAEFEGIQTDMIACFDRNLAESLLIKLAQLKPLRAVFRDHGFANDSMRENVDGIFKQIAPDTDLRVI